MNVQVTGAGVAVAAAQDHILYEIQAQAAGPAGHSTYQETRSCTRPLAAHLSAINEPEVAAHTKMYECRPGSNSEAAAAGNFLQGLAFLQQTGGQTPPVGAVAAVLARGVRAVPPGRAGAGAWGPPRCGAS